MRAEIGTLFGAAPTPGRHKVRLRCSLARARACSLCLCLCLSFSFLSEGHKLLQESWSADAAEPDGIVVDVSLEACRREMQHWLATALPFHRRQWADSAVIEWMRGACAWWAFAFCVSLLVVTLAPVHSFTPRPQWSEWHSCAWHSGTVLDNADVGYRAAPYPELRKPRRASRAGAHEGDEGDAPTDAEVTETEGEDAEQSARPQSPAATDAAAVAPAAASAGAPSVPLQRTKRSGGPQCADSAAKRRRAAPAVGVSPPRALLLGDSIAAGERCKTTWHALAGSRQRAPSSRVRAARFELNLRIRAEPALAGVGRPVGGSAFASSAATRCGFSLTSLRPRVSMRAARGSSGFAYTLALSWSLRNRLQRAGGAKFKFPAPPTPRTARQRATRLMVAFCGFG